MPIMNIIDCRENCCDTLVSVVVEPSFQDNGIEGATQHKKVKLDWVVRELGTMTIRKAITILQDEPAEVTIYLYTTPKRSNQGAPK